MDSSMNQAPQDLEETKEEFGSLDGFGWVDVEPDEEHEQIAGAPAVGRDFAAAPDMLEAFTVSQASNYDFLCFPLAHPRNRRNLLLDQPNLNHSGLVDSEQDDDQESFTRADTALPASNYWVQSCIGKVSDWLDLDAGDEDIRRNSELVLEQELGCAEHLSLQAVVLPPPTNTTRSESVNYCRVVSRSLALVSQVGRIWVRMPAVSEQPADSEEQTLKPDEALQIWRLLRRFSGESEKLFVALELSDEAMDDGLSDRWLAENIGAVFLPASLFTLTGPSRLSLPLHVQIFLFELFDVHPQAQLVVTGLPQSDSLGNALLPELFPKALRSLFAKRPGLSETEAFEKPFRDLLQSPLQPLASNLSSATYEVFELDPVKYTCYENAIYCALLDKFSPSKTGKESVRTAVVMVVGAGRGPLVQATLRASERSGVPVRVYAVEKNPNVILTLRSKARAVWGTERVRVVSHDMRTWNAPEPADLLVSELLGSFGDNELSPECLDGAQRFLREDGVSIPSESTSWLAPISSSKLWGQLSAQALSTRSSQPLEQCYVVKLGRHHRDASPQPCFRFRHPNRPGARHKVPDAQEALADTPEAMGLENMNDLPLEYAQLEEEVKAAQKEAPNALPAEAAALNGGLGGSPAVRIDNNRFASLSWTVEQDVTVHGFAGYFDCKLYENNYLSINPDNFSEGMFSWFPAFFPLKVPLELRAGERITAHFWRQADGSRVWYEWALSSPQASVIHNAGGQHASIGLH